MASSPALWIANSSTCPSSSAKTTSPENASLSSVSAAVRDGGSVRPSRAPVWVTNRRRAPAILAIRAAPTNRAITAQVSTSRSGLNYRQLTTSSSQPAANPPTVCMLDLDAANTPVSAAGDGAGLDVVDYQRRPVARQGATAVTVGGLAHGSGDARREIVQEGPSGPTRRSVVNLMGGGPQTWSGSFASRSRSQRVIRKTGSRHCDPSGGE